MNKSGSAKNALAKNSPSEPGYADSLREIETILAQLDADDVDIDELAALVERAAHLIENCRSRLTAAESSVSKIVAQLDTNDGATGTADAAPAETDEEAF